MGSAQEGGHRLEVDDNSGQALQPGTAAFTQSCG